MNEITLLPADNYVVVNKTILTDNDKVNLINLYEPIIGPLAISLYLTLWSDLDRTLTFSDSYNHHHLMTFLKSNLNDIREARSALEALGLIKTYYKKGDNINYQIIYINDGSTDNTYNKLEEIYKQDKEHIKVINFSRNFGKDAAIYAGMRYSTSKYCAIIDSDMQQNPKYLLQMLNFLENNPDYDQVSMINKDRSNDNFFVKTLKKIFYKFINLISDTNFKEDASDFRMFSKSAKEAVLNLGEINRFSKGIFSWIGFKTKYLEYKVEKRYSGTSKFNLTNSFRYAFNGIINFSTKPLRLATVTGLLTSTISFIYFIVMILETLIRGNNVPGYPSIICLILILGGINLLAIGIVGEYISKIYLEIKKRPIYITKNTLGFDEDVL